MVDLGPPPGTITDQQQVGGAASGETPTLWRGQIMNTTVPPICQQLYARDFPDYKIPKF